MKRITTKLKKFLKDDKVIALNKDVIKLDTDETMPSVPVENYAHVLEFICSDFHQMTRLTKKSRIELTKLFGKHNTTFKGSEFFNYVWIVEYDNEIFNIYVSEKGTSFEIVAKITDKKSKVCIDFLTKMNGMLEELEHKKFSR